MVKIYLSYANSDFKDDEDRRTLDRALEVALVTVNQIVSDTATIKRDVYILPASENWGEVVSETISDSDLFVGLVSPAWLHSKSCAGEFDAFYSRERHQAGPGRIIPIWLCDTTKLHDQLSSKELARLSLLKERQGLDWRSLFKANEGSQDRKYREFGEAIAGMILEIHSLRPYAKDEWPLRAVKAAAVGLRNCVSVMGRFARRHARAAARVAGWSASIAAGAASVVTGLALLAVHDRPSASPAATVPVAWRTDGLAARLSVAGAVELVRPDGAAVIYGHGRRVHYARFDDTRFVSFSRDSDREARQTHVEHAFQHHTISTFQPLRRVADRVWSVHVRPASRASLELVSRWLPMVPLRFRDCVDCPKMVVYHVDAVKPAGPVDIAGPVSAAESNVRILVGTPQRTLAVAQHMVTRLQYAAFVNATGRPHPNRCRDTQNEAIPRNWRNAVVDASLDDPVTCIGSDDARAYAGWLSEVTGRRYQVLGYTARSLIGDTAQQWLIGCPIAALVSADTPGQLASEGSGSVERNRTFGNRGDSCIAEMAPSTDDSSGETPARPECREPDDDGAVCRWTSVGFRVSHIFPQ